MVCENETKKSLAKILTICINLTTKHEKQNTFIDLGRPWNKVTRYCISRACIVCHSFPLFVFFSILFFRLFVSPLGSKQFTLENETQINIFEENSGWRLNEKTDVKVGCEFFSSPLLADVLWLSFSLGTPTLCTESSLHPTSFSSFPNDSIHRQCMYFRRR